MAQARDRWGREAADAIWDSAIVKIILGGSANADDLAGISRLIGEREVRDMTQTRGQGGAMDTTVSVSVRRQPILEPSDIRQIPVGQGLLLLRSAPPIMMAITPWTGRPDASKLSAARTRFETATRAASVA